MVIMDSFEYILAVAEEKNMTKAAAKLFVTQPALSISINRLEKQLGFKIFDRTQLNLHRKVLFTFRKSAESVKKKRNLFSNSNVTSFMGKIIFPWGLALTVVLSGSPFFFPI